MRTHIKKIVSYIRGSKPIMIVLGAVAALAAIALILIALRAYPIAFVNGKPIMAYQYDKGFKIAYQYYSFLNSHSKEMSSVNDGDLQSLLRKAAFEGLVDNIIIDKRLDGDMKKSELQQKIDEQVGIIMNDAQAKKALLDMTQMSEGDVRAYFLDNEAKYQILKGQLDLEGKNVDEWLMQQRKDASVTILISSMKWKGQEVEVNNG
jgi:hypothetical protein